MDQREDEDRHPADPPRDERCGAGREEALLRPEQPPGPDDGTHRGPEHADQADLALERYRSLRRGRFCDECHSALLVEMLSLTSTRPAAARGLACRPPYRESCRKQVSCSVGASTSAAAAKKRACGCGRPDARRVPRVRPGHGAPRIADPAPRPCTRSPPVGHT